MVPHQQLVQRHLPRNFTCMLLDGITAVGGFSALGIASIMPGMIHEVALRCPQLKPYENRIATALMVCFFGLSSVSGFLLGGQDEHKTHRKRPFIVLAFTSRLSFPLLVLTVFFMERLGYQLFVWLFLGSLTWWALVNGVLMPQWFDYVGRLIPVNRRGILFGLRDALGTVLGIAVIAAFPWLSERYAFPYNYGVLYAMGAVLLWASFVTWLPLKEIPYRQDELKPCEPFLASLRKTLAIFKEDHAYRRLLIAMSVVSLGTLASLSLYTLKAINELAMTEIARARFVSLAGIVNISLYALALPVFGLLADRFGYKRIAFVSYSLLVLSFVVAVAAGTHNVFLVAIGVAGVVKGGAVLVNINFPLEFVPENRRPSYMRLKALFSMPVIVAPFVGGWLADRYGYNLVFVLPGVLVVVGLVLFGVTITDPRREALFSARTQILPPAAGRRSVPLAPVCSCPCDDADGIT
ncbi:MAG: MFS transporter [Chitinivibrionales bacterium]|nr:MFS transporter [Chitinivibrionales bacterium]